MSNLALHLSGVSIDYPYFQLTNVDLNLERGSILGLIGPNGAGKSTTIRILMGLLKPDAGRVDVLGYDMLKDAANARWKIGYASEDLRLYKKMTLGWHMQFIKNMFADWDDHYASKLLGKFDLRPEQKIKGLSHGQRVKASLLLILARRPELLVLDEPTTGLDPVARQETLNEMMDVLLDEDRSIVFSSHNTADVEQLSDHIAFIDRGHVVASNDKESFLEVWRRVRVTLPENVSVESLPGVKECRILGHTALLTTNAFSDALSATWQGAGVAITGVDTLTLEEIFLAEIAASRNEDNRELQS